MKHSELLSLLYMLAAIHSDLAAGDLIHPDRNEAHKSDGWIVGLDEDQRSRSDRGEIVL